MTYDNGTRTLTVSSTSTVNVSDVIGYLNTGLLTIIGSSPDLSVTVSSAISSTGTVNGLTIGSSGNIGTIALNAALTLNGPVALNGAMININHSINTTAGGVDGDLLFKASADIVVKQNVSLTTNGGSAIFWANSDGENSHGGVYFKDDNYSATPSVGCVVSTAGGHIWIGGGVSPTTWNGLTVGDYSAVSGRTTEDVYGPTTGWGTDDYQAGVIFNKTTLSSGGGHIYINGSCNVLPPSSRGSGIINYSGATGTLIDAGSGTVEMKGFNRREGYGIMTGLYPDEYSGKFTVRSSKNNPSELAILLEGSAPPTTTHDGILIENHTRLISSATTNGGMIVIVGNGGGPVWSPWPEYGNGILVKNAYAPATLDVLSASGAIIIDAGDNDLYVDNGAFFKIGSISGDADVPSSSANVTLYYETNSLDGNIPIRTSGTCTIMHSLFTGFGPWITTTPYSFEGVSALTIGDATNPANSTVEVTTPLSIAGPITLYGGNQLLLSEDVASTTGSDITLHATTQIVSNNNKRKLISTSGGDITINADLDADGSGMLYLNDMTLDAGSGDIIIRGATLDWKSDDPLPYINGTGTFTLESSGTEFRGFINTSLFEFDQDANGMSGLTIGKSTNVSPVFHDHPGGITVDGPIIIYAGGLDLNTSLTATGASGTIDIKATAGLTMNVPLVATGHKNIEVQNGARIMGDITNLTLTDNVDPQLIEGTATITNLTVDKPLNSGNMSTVALLDMKTVTGMVTVMSGKLAVGGGSPSNLTLKSDANGTARVAAHTNAGFIDGPVIVERFIPATSGATPRQKQWRAIGLPFTQTDMSSISGIGISTTAGSESFMIFNESGDDKTNYGNTGVRNAGYQPLTSSDLIVDGKGVMAWLYGPDNSTPITGGDLSADLTISSYGELNETGNDFVLTNPKITNAQNGWNLVSNPFASPIDWRSVSSVSPSVASTVYRWDPIAANWTTYNATTQTGSTNGSPFIESGSAFFISAATPGVGAMTLTVPQSAKVATTENKHFSKAPFRLDIPGERVRPVADLAGIRLKASGMGNPIPGEAYLDVSRTDATKGWDGKYDGWMMGRSSGANIYFDGEKALDLSMQFDAPLKSGEQRYYPLTVTTPQPGATLIDIAREGKWSGKHTVALIDQKTGRTILMKGDTIKYKIHLEEKKSEGRFILAINHVKPDADGQIPGLQLKALGNPVIGQTIDLLVTHPTASPRRWKVWDMSGREAGTGIFANDGGIQHKLTVSGMRHPGIYIVQVEMDNGETSQIRIQRH